MQEMLGSRYSRLALPFGFALWTASWELAVGGAAVAALCSRGSSVP